jgi:hypothetical protein
LLPNVVDQPTRFSGVEYVERRGKQGGAVSLDEARAMHPYRAALAALSFAFLATLAPLGSSAADNGLAWDSVSKLVVNADASSLQPGSFDADYATAAAAAPPSPGGGGILGKYKQMMATAQNAQQMMQNGLAERHYVVGMKARTDQVSRQTATIVDCAARTITTLDLKAKTYKVVAMGSPSAPPSNESHGNSAGPEGASPSLLAISVANTALGSREVGGQTTDGFRSDITFTETDSSGQSRTQNGNLLGYYSTYADPSTTCFSFDPGAAGGSMGMGMMAGYAQVARVLATSRNLGLSVKQTGPPPPFGKLAMYSAMTFAPQGRQVTFVTERGNVRRIADTDPIFSVPSDFTREK